MLRPRMASVLLMLVVALLHQSPDLCESVNGEGRALLRFKESVEVDPYGALSNWGEGRGDLDPCAWFGVECSDDGRVIALNLKDLCLKGILTPELGKLMHMKSLILNNNSFHGTIPGEIGDLQKLQVLDLGYNNLRGPLPCDLGRILSLEIIVLKSNKHMNNIPPELHGLSVLSELQVDVYSSTGCVSRNVDDANIRRLLRVVSKDKGRRHKHHRTRARSRSPSPMPSISPARLPVVPPSPAAFPPSTSFGPLLGNVPRPLPSLFDATPSPVSPSRSPMVPPSTTAFLTWAPSTTFGPLPSNMPRPSPSPFDATPSPVSPSHSPVVPPAPAVFPPQAPSTTFGPLPSNIPRPLLSPFDVPLSPVPENSRRFDVLLPNSSVPIPPQSKETTLETKHTSSWPIYTSIGGGISCLIALSAIYLFCCRANKLAAVMPWSTGLSGQLQKALVTGVPSLKRSELERACENFSNVVGSSSDCMLYKGTLSSGVEIAVTSTMTMPAKDWSDHSETQFKKKISILSRVNHKNFMNLLGYCEEEEPFTRMMVFEYPPNGTLFEHLHIKEAEHLNWAARLRIAMGIAYCLEHMGQLNPPVVVTSLHSSSIYLCDDYAAKVSDLVFWNHDDTDADPDESPGQSTVYKFGIILLELISGRRPFSEDDGLLVLWASCYLTGKRPLRDMVDSTLESFFEEDVRELCELIRPCINPDPRERPTMTVVVDRLKNITAMAADGAMPKLSPLWWAELEIISADVS